MVIYKHNMDDFQTILSKRSQTHTNKNTLYETIYI